MELSKIGNITELKEQLGNELNKAAASFVRIGYLLKLARDTDILKDSSYSSVNEFASAEFGLDKTQVSRFIRINDRFAIGGYSETLKVEYNNYGSAKLSLMLTLPDEINEELSPEYSKSDIETIKAEYEAEQKISDLEVMMEEPADGPDDFLQAVIKELNDEHDEVAAYFAETIRMAKKLGVEPNEADVKEAYMPDGDKTYSIRISGQGRFMINMKASGISIVNTRALDEKSTITWEEFKELILNDFGTRSFPEPEKPKQKPKSKKVEPAKPAKIQNEDVAPVQPEPVEQCTEDVAQEDKTEGEENKEAAGPEEKDPVDITHPGLYSKVEPEETIKAVSFNEAHPAAGDEGESQQESEKDTVEEAPPAAGVEDEARPVTEADSEAQMAAGDVLTSSQTEALQMIDEIRHMIAPDDGSRPNWSDIYGKIIRLSSYAKQFTY